MEAGILEGKKGKAHISKVNDNSPARPLVSAFKRKPSIGAGELCQANGQLKDAQRPNLSINRFFEDDFRNNSVEDALRKFIEEFSENLLKFEAANAAKNLKSDLESHKVKKKLKEKSESKKKIKSRSIVKYDKNNNAKAGKKWDKEKQLEKALVLCDPEEVDGLIKFIDLLRETGYVASKGYFHAKKIVTLYRFLETIEKISDYTVSKKLGFIFPSDKYLIKTTKLCKRTISRYLLDLEKMGIIERKTTFNVSNDCSYHSFRKIFITPEYEIEEKNEAYEPSKPKFVDKKYFLNRRERFYFFKSLFLKYKAKHKVIHNTNCYDENPYLYEYTRPFGSDQSQAETTRAYYYPVVEPGNKVKWLWYQKY